MTKEKWINFSWEGIIPRKTKENLTVNFNKKCNSILPFEQACDLVACEINSKFDNLFLALSGGADSECVANSLVRNNVKFTPIIVEFNFKFPCNESWYAHRWCQNNNIKPYVLRLDYETVLPDYTRILNQIHPRLELGPHTIIAMQEVERLNGYLLTGAQVEYHPDEIYTGAGVSSFSGIPMDYKGFIINEDDAYIEVVSPGRHPDGFFYWSPEILASTVAHWDTSLQMPEAKSKLYNTLLRPKLIDYGFVVQNLKIGKRFTSDVFGNIDCALIGNREEVLTKLVNDYSKSE